MEGLWHKLSGNEPFPPRSRCVSGMPSAHHGCRATLLRRDWGCGRPSVSGSWKGWLRLIPDRCLHQIC